MTTASRRSGPSCSDTRSQSRDEAVRFVDNIREGGSTNINAALKAALAMIPDPRGPSYVLFLTDGLPTAGETRRDGDRRELPQGQRPHARIFAFGVGYDVNARLLDRLSGGNSGTSEYVKPDEDIETHVARFYSKMTSPVLADIRDRLRTDVNRVYPRDLPDLFEGGQFVVAGRYRESGRTTLRLSGNVGDERQTFDVPRRARPAGSRHFATTSSRGSGPSGGSGSSSTRSTSTGQNKELIDELVALSTRYGILTPYTSFLADERVGLHAMTENRARTSQNLLALRELGGEAGVEQRGLKQSLMSANQAASPPVALGEGEVVARRAKAKAASKGMGGMMGGSSGMLGYGMSGGRSEDSSKTTIRRIGSKTFFRKGNAWFDSTLKADDGAKAIVIRQFSDEYFDLARNQKSEFNQYLTFDEPVTVNLDNKVYRFEQAAK